MNIWIYNTLLVGCGAYALLRGGRDERLAVLIIAIGTLASELVAAPPAGRFRSFETGIFLVDLAVFVAFVLLSMISRRRWPMLVAGLQGSALWTHFIRAITPGITPWAYNVLAVAWGYLMLLAIAVGIWRRVQRRKRRERT